MKKVWINGVEVQDFSDDQELPTIHDMIEVVRFHIMRFRGVKVDIKLNLKNENKELLLLEKVYRHALQFL